MKNIIRKSLHFIEQGIDKLRYIILKRESTIKKAHIIPYHGYGNNDFINIEGRILKKREIVPSTVENNAFENIGRMYKYFHSIELPGISVTATYNEEVLTTVSDDEGYFKFKFSSKHLIKTTKLWHKASIKLTEKQEGKTNVTAWILIPRKEANYGIISDIDDTIIQTGATNLLKSITTTFTKNASTRLPFLGVPEFYTGLQKGDNSSPINPIFYLSNSPWNLYDFLTEFIKLNKIPKGPLLLRDWGIDDKKLIVDDNHKINSIIKLLNTYTELSFILIGDSGEKDPEYYKSIVQQFPNRILAIYIRNVSKEPRISEVKNIVKDVENFGVPMLLMKDTFKAAEHAKTMQWITEETVNLVKDVVHN